jgi:hypothetical protein
MGDYGTMTNNSLATGSMTSRAGVQNNSFSIKTSDNDLGAALNKMKLEGDQFPFILSCNPTRNPGDTWFFVPEQTHDLAMRVHEFVKKSRNREPKELTMITIQNIMQTMQVYGQLTAVPSAHPTGRISQIAVTTSGVVDCIAKKYNPKVARDTCPNDISAIRIGALEPIEDKGDSLYDILIKPRSVTGMPLTLCAFVSMLQPPAGGAPGAKAPDTPLCKFKFYVTQGTPEKVMQTYLDKVADRENEFHKDFLFTHASMMPLGAVLSMVTPAGHDDHRKAIVRLYMSPHKDAYTTVNCMGIQNYILEDAKGMIASSDYAGPASSSSGPASSSSGTRKVPQTPVDDTPLGIFLADCEKIQLSVRQGIAHINERPKEGMTYVGKERAAQYARDRLQAATLLSEELSTQLARLQDNDSDSSSTATTLTPAGTPGEIAKRHLNEAIDALGTLKRAVDKMEEDIKGEEKEQERREQAAKQRCEDTEAFKARVVQHTAAAKEPMDSWENSMNAAQNEKDDGLKAQQMVLAGTSRDRARVAMGRAFEASNECLAASNPPLTGFRDFDERINAARTACENAFGTADKRFQALETKYLELTETPTAEQRNRNTRKLPKA